MVAEGLRIGASLLSGLVVATEWFAYSARLDGALGAPWWHHGFLAIYPPWGLFSWAWAWGELAPRAFLVPTVVGGFVAVLLLVKLWPTSQHGPGQAHWATTRELKQAECLSDTGIVLGKVRD